MWQVCTPCAVQRSLAPRQDIQFNSFTWTFMFIGWMHFAYVTPVFVRLTFFAVVLHCKLQVCNISVIVLFCRITISFIFLVFCLPRTWVARQLELGYKNLYQGLDLRQRNKIYGYTLASRLTRSVKPSNFWLATLQSFMSCGSSGTLSRMPFRLEKMEAAYLSIKFCFPKKVWLTH